jgi:hypothetical protein
MGYLGAQRSPEAGGQLGGGHPFHPEFLDEPPLIIPLQALRDSGMGFRGFSLHRWGNRGLEKWNGWFLATQEGR